jgi:glycosyltransferase involved in cell wall biosynthesis
MAALRICHFSSVHPADDVRIFYKQCQTLASRLGWEVHLVGNGPLSVKETHVIFHPLPPFSGKGRLMRMLVRGWQAYRQASAVNAEVYHFHDPELLPWGLLLKLRGKKVIYDAHEDVPRDILHKDWIPKPLRVLIATVTERIENFTARRLDWVIAATPFIRDRFLLARCRAIDINNFPRLGELDSSINSTENLRDRVCYVGAITEERGASQMIDASALSGVKLILAGRYSPSMLREKLAQRPGWTSVEERGVVNRECLSGIFSVSFAGLVLFHAVPNNVNAQPNKLFEYMSAGLPIIASDFPLWRQIVDQVGCGICVDPLRAEAVAEAIRWLQVNPSAARKMGEQGMHAVQQHFNWGVEGEKLLGIYEDLLADVSCQ